ARGERERRLRALPRFRPQNGHRGKTEPATTHSVGAMSKHQAEAVMRLLHSVAFGLALASGAASAQAQVITRQVTQEPVETTVTRGPAGTIITRRPLAPAPVAPTVGAVTVEQRVAPASGTLGTVQLEPYEMQSIGPGPTYTETV